MVESSGCTFHAAGLLTNELAGSVDGLKGTEALRAIAEELRSFSSPSSGRCAPRSTGSSTSNSEAGFGLAAWTHTDAPARPVAYGVAGHPAICAAFATLTALHSTVARPRVQWLLSR